MMAGYLVSFPDFAECISDDETVEEAIANGRDALKSTIAALKAKKLPVPTPNSGGVASGKFVARVPKTVMRSWLLGLAQKACR